MKASKATSGVNTFRQCFRINFCSVRLPVVCPLGLMTFFFFPFKVHLCVLANAYINGIYSSCWETTAGKNTVWLWIASIVRTRVIKFHCLTIYHSIKQAVSVIWQLQRWCACTGSTEETLGSSKLCLQSYSHSHHYNPLPIWEEQCTPGKP